MTEPDEKKQEELKLGQMICENPSYARGYPNGTLKQYLTINATQVVDNTYIGDRWQVTLSEERQETIGACSLVAVDVTLAVEKDQFDDFLFSFRKKFSQGRGLMMEEKNHKKKFYSLDG